MSWDTHRPRTYMTVRTVTLGQRFLVKGYSGPYTVKFISVTKKGFNFLVEESHKVLFKSGHFYAKGYSGKEFELGKKTFDIWMPEFAVGILDNELPKLTKSAGVQP